MSPAEGRESTEVDLDLVLAEIHAEAARIRASRRHDDAELDAAFRRHTPPDLDVADMGDALTQLDALSAVSVPVPDSAPRPGRAEWKRTILRAIGRFLRAEPVTRAIRMATSEVTAFNAAVVRVLRRLDQRVSILESRVGEPDAAVHAAADQALPDTTPPVVVDAIVAAIGAPCGRVLHAGCARGDTVRALADAGIGVYGVDERRALHVEVLRDGLDVRGETPSLHLAALAERSLGSVILDGTLDRHSVENQVAMLDAAVRATVPGGRVLVVLSERTGTAAVAADLIGGRPLLPATWEHLLALRATDVRRSEAAGVEILVGDIGP